MVIISDRSSDVKFRKVVEEMKMTQRTINILAYTVAALVFVLVFGYTFRAFSEINAMDLSSLNSDKMGIPAANITEDSSKAEPGEAEAAARVETVVNNSMNEKDMISSIRADYENKRMVLLIMSDGTAAAAKAENPDEWNRIAELGKTCSAEGEQILKGDGMDDWSFDVEILNDSYPVNAVLTFTDGECTYSAR